MPRSAFKVSPLWASPPHLDLERPSSRDDGQSLLQSSSQQDVDVKVAQDGGPSGTGKQEAKADAKDLSSMPSSISTAMSYLRHPKFLRSVPSRDLMGYLEEKEAQDKEVRPLALSASAQKQRNLITPQSRDPLTTRINQERRSSSDASKQHVTKRQRESISAESHAKIRALESQVQKLKDTNAALMEKLRGPIWRSNDESSMLALVKRVQSLLPSWNIMAGLGQEETTVDTEVTLLDFLTGCGIMNGDVLALFRNSPVGILDLATTFANDAKWLPEAHGRILVPLSASGGFRSLQVLDLSHGHLSDSDILCIRDLSLTTLIAKDCGLSSIAVLHLIHLKDLMLLDLTDNKAVDDRASIALNYLEQIKILHLRGTSFSLQGCRSLISLHFQWGERAIGIGSIDNPTPEENYSVRLSKLKVISVPETCLDYLKTRGEHYALELPNSAAFTSDPDQVERLHHSDIKANLLHHAKCNPQLQVGGSRAGCMMRLKALLYKRQADDRLVQRVVKKGDT